ncbi:MAG: alpha-galactosidase [Bacilli bacterium]|nr:alpha-galactosidase [Bacilli bacterium]
MIKEFNNVIRLDTKNTTYLIRISAFNHILSEYYGDRLGEEDEFLFSMEKFDIPGGSAVAYDDSKPGYCLDYLSTEISSVGKGDYKDPSLIIDNGKDYVLDLTYKSHEINKTFTKVSGLPNPHGDAEELVIHLSDELLHINVDLHYVVFEDSDVIARRMVLTNRGDTKISINKAMSLQLDMVGKNFELINLYGGWCFEGQKSSNTLDHTLYVNDSKTGASSNRHNPFFALKEKEATGLSGGVYGFNLIYSGNHYESVEHSSFNKVRVMLGVSPYCFKWNLASNEIFETPFAVMTYSSNGVNGMSQNMHNFVREHISPSCHKGNNHPILVNNWEATYMKFKASNLKKIAKTGSKLGLEMFVLDDGWFGRREDDTKGLGDYDVNKKKLPSGLDGLAKSVNKKGMQFGLWFEPEMISVDSKLYEEHPDWAIHVDGRNPSLGRHQLVLDLTRDDVISYIIENVNKTIDDNNVQYVKWDMNRHISDLSSNIYSGGELFHRYILGLYKLYEGIIASHPNVFFEGCSSGGNRFDLGGLAYFDQIWTSDDTDAYERLSIQSGYSLAYPLSTLSNHVAAETSHQALRKIPLETRFNVALFGSLGYELDISTLEPVEKKAVESQIEFSKEHRNLIMDGDFYQLKDVKRDGYSLWLVVSKDKKEAILGYFNGLQRINPSVDEIRLVGLESEAKYTFQVRHQDHNIHLFGGLINQVLPIKVNEKGFLVYEVSKRMTMPGENEEYSLSGKSLMAGALKLKQQWMGTGFNDDVRLLGDFGSRVYHIKAK